MDERRVTEVFAPASHPDRTAMVGSGYLVTDALVLTAGHVVGPATGGACQVRPLGQDKWRQARVVWRAKSCDAALLELEGFEGQSRQAGRARLGRLATGWRAPCRALGFPLAQARPGSHASVRDTEEITGELAPLTLIKGGQLTIHISGSVPLPNASGQSSWAGMSGAALFSGPLLVGVVTIDPAHFGTDRLEAVPVTEMAAEPGFRALLTEQAEQELVLEAVEDIMSDALKVRLWRLLSRHAPFGGRDAELAKLNAFLAGRPSGYVFVTAPSGFGKTALLAYWLGLLEQTEDHSFVAYTFMSRLDGLADEDFTLRNLCQQLASFHGEHGPLPASTTEVHARYNRLLTTPAAGKRLVIILDGLDEASEWTPGPDLFPHDLPPGVFVVFSARQIAEREWLEALELPAAGVEILQLTTLGLAEVGGLLKAAGDPMPSWARQQTALEAMLEVSGGDPFYLRFLVEDLSDERIASVDELRKQPAGLTVYFDKWWKQVSGSASEKRVRDLLGYLLVSRGLLTRDDLTRISDDDDLDGFTFESALEPVQRFVIGDAEAGYALCHPRFQAYLGHKRVKEPDQKPYRDRLLAFCARWKTNKSRYALAHYVPHLAEATQVAAETELDALAKRLAELVVDLEFHRAYLEITDDLPGLQRDLEVALDRVAEATPTPIEPVVRATLGLEEFRRAWLRPESVFDLAEQGQIDDAQRRLALFETDERWFQVARLLIVWLGAESAPAPAATLKSRLAAELPPWAPLPLLLERVESLLGEGPKPTLRLPYPPYELPAPPPDEETAGQIVSRMGGAPDAEMHISGIESFADKGDAYGDETPAYVAEGDSPSLVAFAAATPNPGDALLREYIGIHASNPYAEYRNRSLWGILGAVCCHEKYEEARDLVRRLTTAALAPTSVWFREGLRLTVEALRARADQPGALQRFEARVAEAIAALSDLEEIRWKADSWGNHCRRLAALAEAEALVLGREEPAKQLLDEARRLPFGFAGYQSSASLTLAEAYRICRPDEPAASLAAVNAARRAAHNIQEPAFCARRTARANAMLGHWWTPPIEDLAAVVSRFVADPHGAEFAPVHCVGETYAKRSRKERLAIPDTMRQAATLTQIARDVYQVPVAALRRLNPEIDPDEPPQAGTEVRVPEPKFAPLMAARLAAEALVDPAVQGDRGALIRRLVPGAAENPTAMYTILSRLLLAVQPNDHSVLDEIEAIAPSDWLDEPEARAATEFGPS